MDRSLLLARCVTRIAGSAVATLILWTFAPMLIGWSPVVITSGSMQPGVRPGDIVVVEPVDATATPLDVGDVATYRQPGAGHRVTHRVEAVNDDGTYTTKGDANERADSTPLPADHVEGRARVLVPYAGMAATSPAARVVATVAGLAIAARRLRRRPETSRRRADTSAARTAPLPVATAGVAWTAPLVAQRSVGGVVRRGMIVLVLLAASSVAVAPSVAALSGTTDNPGNSWQAVDLAPPTGLSATSGCSGTTTTVTLGWTATTSAPADGYDLYRKTIDGAETKIATIADPTTTGYVDSTVATGTYTYTLTTTLDVWTSERSEGASALVSSC